MLLHFYGFSMGYIWGKSNFEKTCPKELFDAFMMIWVWKSGFNSWNQNFWKCTLFVWSTVSADSHHSSPSELKKSTYKLYQEKLDMFIWLIRNLTATSALHVSICLCHTIESQIMKTISLSGNLLTIPTKICPFTTIRLKYWCIHRNQSCSIFGNV